MVRGVVYRVNETSLTVALDERSGSQEDNDAGLMPLLRVVKLANEATYDRLSQTLKKLVELVGVPPLFSQERPTDFVGTPPEIVRVLLGLRPPSWKAEAPAWTPIHPRLNDTQRAAISFALRAEHLLSLIHI